MNEEKDAINVQLNEKGDNTNRKYSRACVSKTTNPTIDPQLYSINENCSGFFPQWCIMSFNFVYCFCKKLYSFCTYIN